MSRLSSQRPPPLQLPTPDSSTTTLALPSMDSSTTLNDSYFSASEVSFASTASSSPFFSNPRYKQWQHQCSARSALKKWMRSPDDPLLPFPLVGRGGEKLHVAKIREAEETRRAEYIEELRCATLLDAGEEGVFSYMAATATPPASPVMPPQNYTFYDDDDDDEITMEDCRPLWYYIQSLRSDLRELEEEEEKKERHTQHRNFSLFMAPGSPTRSLSSDSERLSWTTNGRGIFTVTNGRRFSNISAVSTGSPRFAITRTTEKYDLAGNRISTPPLAWESIFGERWRASTPPVRTAPSSRVISHEGPMTPIRFERPVTPISPLDRSTNFSMNLFERPSTNKLVESCSTPNLYQPRPITLNLFERPTTPYYFKPEPLKRAATTPSPPDRSPPSPFERPLTPRSPSPSERSTTPTSPLAPPIPLRKPVDEVGFISALDIAYNRPVIGRDARGFFVPPPAPPAPRPQGPPETFSAMDIVRRSDEEQRYSAQQQGPVKRLFRSRTHRTPASPCKENRRPSFSYDDRKETRRPSIDKQRQRRPSAVGSLDTVEEDRAEEKRESTVSSSTMSADTAEKEKKTKKWGSGGERLFERAKKMSWGKAMGSMSKRIK